MSAVEKSKILTLLADSLLPHRHTLAQQGLAKSTYYRWLRRQTKAELEDGRGGSRIPWNKPFGKRSLTWLKRSVG